MKKMHYNGLIVGILSAQILVNSGVNSSFIKTLAIMTLIAIVNTFIYSICKNDE